jgi:hypothetical protein
MRQETIQLCVLVRDGVLNPSTTPNTLTEGKVEDVEGEDRVFLAHSP